MDEDIPWGYLSGTEQVIIETIEEVNEYRKREKTGGRTVNTNTNTLNVSKKKENIKDKIDEPDNIMVGSIPK